MESHAGRAVSKAKAGSTRHTVQVETHSRVEFKDITAQLHKMVEQSGVENGSCIVFTPHTTAAILINENDDTALRTDFDEFLKRLAPHGAEYHHNDGNCDSHLKAAVIGCSKTLLVENRRLVLGRWQGVYFCEFDGPRRRELRVKIVAD